MTKYFKNKKLDNTYFIATNFIPNELSKDWKEITKEQYEEETRSVEEETPEEE